jgi:hypothetical protein
VSAEDAGRTELLPRRPLSTGEIVEGGLGLFRATLGPAIRAVAVVYAPLAVLSALSAEATADLDPADPFANLTAGDAALAGLATFVGFVVGPLVAAAVTWIGLERSRGNQLSWSDGYRAASGAFGRIVLATLLLGAVAFGVILALALVLAVLALAGTELAVLAGIAVGLPLLLALVALSYLIVPVILLEDAGATAAVRRAWQLLRVRFWPTLATVVASGLLAIIAGAVVGITFTALGSVLGPASFVGDALGSALASMVTVPFITYVALLIHVDATVRLEGPDAVRLPPPAVPSDPTEA